MLKLHYAAGIRLGAFIYRFWTCSGYVRELVILNRKIVGVSGGNKWQTEEFGSVSSSR